MKRLAAMLAIAAVFCAVVLFLNRNDPPKPEAKPRIVQSVQSNSSNPESGKPDASFEGAVSDASKSLANHPAYRKFSAIVKRLKESLREQGDLVKFRAELRLLIREHPEIAQGVAGYFIQETAADALFAIAWSLSQCQSDQAAFDIMSNQMKNGDAAHKHASMFFFAGTQNAEIIELMRSYMLEGETNEICEAATMLISESLETISADQIARIKDSARREFLDAATVDRKTYALDIMAHGGLSDDDAIMIRNRMLVTTEKSEQVAYLKTLIDYKRMKSPEFERLYSSKPESDEDFRIIDRLVKEISESIPSKK